jgi:hypothetical protein
MGRKRLWHNLKFFFGAEATSLKVAFIFALGRNIPCLALKTCSHLFPGEKYPAACSQ